ncbi:MAG: BtrH N-terminal domain-containing protein [Bacteroidales bacterium]|nr:BtrH N-terminal domain-containing protein [Bacteroidales bacterium]
MKEIDFKHKMAAHCETGTVTSLLNHKGLDITEPMVFGLSSGIFFGYFESSNFPFPTFIVRNKPGSIRTNISKRLGVKFYTKKFRSDKEGEGTLNELILKDIPTAVQVDFYYMDYMPDYQRVHINVHFVNIIGMNDSSYLISDSYFPKKSELKKTTMQKARFAGGYMEPKGFLFYPEYIPEEIDFEKAIIKAIKKNAFYMLKLPVPFVGIKGMRKFARKVTDWPNIARDVDHLSHEIMRINILLEDQGTGGAGFRYLYATFLQQAADIVKDDGLKDMSKRMMEIGDNWRNISYFAAKIGKNRDLGPERLKELSEMINARADEEYKFFNDLNKLVK